MPHDHRGGAEVIVGRVSSSSPKPAPKNSMTNILTLRLDDSSQQFFEGMRRKHFPPERNLIPAHLTLFHSLPDMDAIDEALSTQAAQQVPFPIAVNGLRSLGKGVAYKVSSPPLLTLSTSSLPRPSKSTLPPQDRAAFSSRTCRHPEQGDAGGCTRPACRARAHLSRAPCRRGWTRPVALSRRALGACAHLSVHPLRLRLRRWRVQQPVPRG